MSHDNVKLHRPRIKRPKAFTTAAPSTTAVSIAAENLRRATIVIKNAHASVTAYLGNSSGVTAANGYPLAPGQEFRDDVSTDAWFAITSAGTSDLRIVEV